MVHDSCRCCVTLGPTLLTTNDVDVVSWLRSLQLDLRVGAQRKVMGVGTVFKFSGDLLPPVMLFPADICNLL